jgi:hypothetical protein
MRKPDVFSQEDSFLAISKEEATKKLCVCKQNPPGVASKKVSG